MTNEDDWVLDPFLGTGTSIIAAVRHNRRGIGAEIKKEYVDIAYDRINKAGIGILKTRPMNKPVYDPELAGEHLKKSPREKEPEQLKLFDNKYIE
jgi:adenine-specific DNA-methyltransferase